MFYRRLARLEADVLSLLRRLLAIKSLLPGIMKSLQHLACLACVYILSSVAGHAAVSAAFTYQGKLMDGTTAANGRYDLRFAVFDVAERGRPLAGPVTNAAVLVSNGVFTTAVDLGHVFNSDPRWLEVAVRLSKSETAFVVLTPRQEMTSTP